MDMSGEHSTTSTKNQQHHHTMHTTPYKHSYIPAYSHWLARNSLGQASGRDIGNSLGPFWRRECGGQVLIDDKFPGTVGSHVVRLRPSPRLGRLFCRRPASRKPARRTKQMRRDRLISPKCSILTCSRHGTTANLHQHRGGRYYDHYYRCYCCCHQAPLVEGDTPQKQTAHAPEARHACSLLYLDRSLLPTMHTDPPPS